ncbi:hypothetical protein A0H81_04428 [Grifola frondosa]|uniref:Uncharacterized protein n=1 Tax=Grifola frondosa TaxID=5627 RepID=A0A1C7MEA6_GRIFR|nr:hypothetical protein A0H81_04428 [Grifola frondosa]
MQPLMDAGRDNTAAADVAVTPCADYHRRATSPMPSLRTGYLVLAASLAFFAFGSYAVLFSAFTPLTGLGRVARSLFCILGLTGCVQVLDVLARDTHYKYLVIMLIPAGTAFVISNWVGWQYYRNS